MDFYSSQEWLDTRAGNPEGEAGLTWLLEQARLETGAHILDLCCGKGDAFERLLSLGFSVTGVDQSERALALAAARWQGEVLGRKETFCLEENRPGIRVLKGDARNIPLGDLSADAVLCQCSLSLLGNDGPHVLDEVHRVLKDSGVLMLSDLVLPGRTETDWKKLLAAHGFVLEAWHDMSAVFRAYCMEYLWNNAKPFPVCACGAAAGQKLADLGYFLGVWKKGGIFDER